MVYDPLLLDRLQEVPPLVWSGRVYRHMFAGYHPTLENTRGARWNPPGVHAIYTSLERDTALAEAEYRISLEPVPPRVMRTVYTIQISLHSVLDLRDPTLLGELGISAQTLANLDWAVCQALGGGVAFLDHDGLLVPSARSVGSNLVIYPTNQQPDAQFEILDQEVISG